MTVIQRVNQALLSLYFIKFPWKRISSCDYRLSLSFESATQRLGSSGLDTVSCLSFYTIGHTVNDHCHVYELSLVMNIGLSLGSGSCSDQQHLLLFSYRREFPRLESSGDGGIWSSCLLCFYPWSFDLPVKSHKPIRAMD